MVIHTAMNKNTLTAWPTVRGFDIELTFNKDNKPYITRDMMKTVSGWGVNCIRLHINCSEGDEVLYRPEDYEPDNVRNNSEDGINRYLKSMEELGRLLDFADEYGFYVIPTLCALAPRVAKQPLYDEETGEGWYRLVAEYWTDIIKRYGTHPKLLAYDILNEPHGENENKWFLSKCAPTVIESIRKLDKKTFIMIPAVNWDLPRDFRDMVSFDGERIVYTVHCYDPQAYTHQGLYGYEKNISYPGESHWFHGPASQYWDKDAIRDTLKYVRDFQIRNNVNIYVGEFSAIRWAPGAAQYIEDSISLFEEYGWGWAFHSWAEFHGWSPTMPSDETYDKSWGYGNAKTDRLEVLLKYFSKNNQ